MQMNSWIDGIQSAIAYIEENITRDMDIADIAARAYVSEFHFQRIFSILCGFTVGEYIRNRRLSLAAQELSATDAKVIDLAMKYGYDSPDSFARAFQRFHGISPSQARHAGARLRAFAPVRIKLTLEGGSMLEYRIEEKHQFTVMGYSRRFCCDTSYDEIPKFWGEHLAAGENRAICGQYGVCIDSKGSDFDYMIADNYIPWQSVPNGCVVRVIPASAWAIFPCTLGTLQSTNTRIWSQWLPALTGYQLAGNYNIELYSPPAPDSNASYCEIWVPIEKA